MAYITNGGARLIERARLEGKSLVFGSVRMNTVYESNPSELVQHREAWFGEPVGAVIGCLSHVTVDGSSHVCDAKIAIQCDDSKPWKSIGVYAHIEGEDSGETLLACESIQNGDYKNVTVIELPVTLDGAIADFGLSEGGGGGGEGDVPANMMTTDTEQTGLTGRKQWVHQTYTGEASAESPNVGDVLNVTHANIGGFSSGGVDEDGRPVSYPIDLSNTPQIYSGSDWGMGESSYAKLSPLGVLDLNSGAVPDGEYFRSGKSLKITAHGVDYTIPGEYLQESATWHDIINAANSGGGEGTEGTEGTAPLVLSGSESVQTISGNISIWNELITASGILIHDGIVFEFDENKQLARVHTDSGVATISVRVFDDYRSGNEVGIVNGVCDLNNGLSFDTPVALAKNYLFMWSIVKAPVLV